MVGVQRRFHFRNTDIGESRGRKLMLANQ